MSKPQWDWQQTTNPLRAHLSESDAAIVQQWLCRRHAQLQWSTGCKRKTDHPAISPEPLTLKEWREERGWSMVDLIRATKPFMDPDSVRYIRGCTIESIREIEQGTSDYRHYEVIKCIEQALGIGPGELRVERKYKPRAAA